MIWFPLSVFALLIILGLTFIPDSKKGSGFIFSCVFALLASFLVSFLYSFIKKSFPLTDDAARIMLHYMVHDHLFFYYPGAVTVLLCLLCIRKDFTRYSAQAAASVLFLFYMFLAMLATFFYLPHGNWADPHLIFYLAGSRIFQCLAFASVAHFVVLKSEWFYMLTALIVILIIPFVTAFVSYFYYTCNIRMAGVFLILIYCAALAVYSAAVILGRRLKA